MHNDLVIHIPCKSCGNKATNFKQLDKDKGFECYCDKHQGNTESDLKAIQRILNRR
jgi:hypothetical protein